MKSNFYYINLLKEINLSSFRSAAFALISFTFIKPIDKILNQHKNFTIPHL